MLTGIHDALIIHNPVTGRRRSRRAADLDTARRILREARIETELRETTGRASATQLASAAARQGKQLVIACGGDGTINEVANGLAGTRVPLAVLPAGTANVLAKELGLPWDIPAAARLIPPANLRRIAMGLATAGGAGKGGGRYFLCVAGAGPDGSMIYSVNQRLKLQTGMLAYWLEGFRHLLSYRLHEFAVAAAGQQFAATLVMVGRTKHYGGPFRITTGASLLEDSFEVAVYTTRNRLRYLLFMPAAWLYALRRMSDIRFLKAEVVSCEPNSAEKIYVQVDGEPAGTLPMEFRIVPDALEVVFPSEPVNAPGAGD